MRFVDPQFVEEALPVEMVARSLDLTRRLTQLTSPSKTLDKEAQGLWSDLKPFLALVMNNKCWYCESQQDRSDDAVDHFRPKSVYWWLSGDYINFRYACTFCNSRRNDVEGTSGGKADEFPLLDESVRALAPRDGVASEAPVLLDPCHLHDTQHLWFDETGMPRLNPRMSSWPGAQRRLEQSIRFLHLDQSRLTRSRRRKHLDVVTICREGDQISRAYDQSGDRALLTRWSEKVVQVRRLIDVNSPHSAAARCAVLGLPQSKTATEALTAM